jgi:hypothetical protein
LGLFTIIVLGEVVFGVVAGLSAAEPDAKTVITGMLALWMGFGLWWIYFDLVGRRLPRADGGALSNWVLSHLPITGSITAAGAGMVSLIGHAHDATAPAATSWLLAGPEGEQLGVPGERLEGSQHVLYGHACSAGNARTLGRDPFGTPLVPAVERREVAGVPDLMEAGGAQVPVPAELACHGAQVLAEVLGRRAAPEPVAVVDAVDDQPRPEHQGVRDPMSRPSACH